MRSNGYDFAIYGFLAATIGRRFFPAVDDTASLLSSLGVFGVGFVARPLGGLLLGRLGDSQGRKGLLLHTMLLMAGSTLLIGCLPGYDQIGIAAPTILILLRLIQGFSLGAEWAAAGVFIVEWAPPGRRGLFGSFHQVSGSLGLLLGSLVVALLTTLLAPQTIDDWGWRLPFLLGALLGPVAMILRRRIVETPTFLATRNTQRHPRVGLVRNAILCMRSVHNMGRLFYIFLSFMPSFVQKQLGFSGAWRSGLIQPVSC